MSLFSFRTKKSGPKLKYIFFDNDGVLVNTEHLFFQANDDILKENFSHKNIRHTLEDFHNYNIFTNKGAVKYMAEQGLTPNELTEFYHLRNERYYELIQAGNLVIPGVKETLETLRQKYKLAMTTAATSQQVKLMHKHSGLRPFFEFEIHQNHVNKIKPEPDVYLMALAEAHIKPREAVVIEDSPRGIAAARQAGIFVITIPNDFTSHLDLSEANVCLQSITELPAFLETYQITNN